MKMTLNLIYIATILRRILTGENYSFYELRIRILKGGIRETTLAIF